MREIKFRAWDKKCIEVYGTGMSYGEPEYFDDMLAFRFNHFESDNPSEIIYEQFTGLRDKNGLTDIYEGDILNAEGIVYANVHEGNVGSRFDLLIASMGTATWRDTEQEAIKRGCHYA